MLSKVYSSGLAGIDGFEVIVECSAQDRLPQFELVGLPDAAVKEAKERVRSACENSGFRFPETALTVNLAPANRKKEGSAFDLAILCGILQCDDIVSRGVSLEDKCFIGELSLSGELRPVPGILSMCLSARAAGRREIYVPEANAGEAAVVDGIAVYPVRSISQLVAHLNGKAKISPRVCDRSAFRFGPMPGDVDFSDVRGQQRAKRALEIAAAGGHNVLMIGPPGAGKSMLAKRLPSILPDFSFEEAIETTKIHSIANLLGPDASLVSARPFRAPHHTMSAPALVGGGANPKPGEISLAHNGVLFLDELPEFSKTATDALRQPLEDGRVIITRAMGRVAFPCAFMLVCAMNPCKCGYFGSTARPCACKPGDIKKYMARISGPLLDRIDIQIEVPAVSFEELSSDAPAESSAEIRARINRARGFARARFAVDPQAAGVWRNADMTARHIRTHCKTDEAGKRLLKNAFASMGLSARGHDRILRVARTIADLEESDIITAAHLAEAIQLRSLDRKYFR